MEEGEQQQNAKPRRLAAIAKAPTKATKKSATKKATDPTQKKRRPRKPKETTSTTDEIPLTSVRGIVPIEIDPDFIVDEEDIVAASAATPRPIAIDNESNNEAIRTTTTTATGNASGAVAVTGQAPSVRQQGYFVENSVSGDFRKVRSLRVVHTPAPLSSSPKAAEDEDDFEDVKSGIHLWLETVFNAVSNILAGIVLLQVMLTYGTVPPNLEKIPSISISYYAFLAWYAQIAAHVNKLLLVLSTLCVVCCTHRLFTVDLSPAKSVRKLITIVYFVLFLSTIACTVPEIKMTTVFSFSTVDWSSILSDTAFTGAVAVWHFFNGLRAAAAVVGWMLSALRMLWLIRFSSSPYDDHVLFEKAHSQFGFRLKE